MSSPLHGLFLRDDCVQCPEAPVCNCSADQDCFQINRDCFTCPSIQCQNKKGSSTSSGKSVSKGALAGAVVGVLIFLAIVVGLFLWYRRSSRFAARRNAVPEIKDVPAAAADVLNRPDPTEKALPSPAHSTVRHYPGSSTTTIDLDPHSLAARQLDRRSSVQSNPFTDSHSIQTAGTEGTNVIPIALVSPDTRSELSATPSRPARSPELQLNLDHVNVSADNLRPNGPPSQRSGLSGTDNRNSYMTSATYDSELLNEAPMIVTPTRGTVRHVLGTVKAEVIDARGSHSDGLRTPGGRPSVGSPLAVQSFGPTEFSRNSSSTTGTENPFSDAHISTQVQPSSPSASVTTFGQASPGLGEPQWATDSLARPWDHQDGISRPSSMSTQAGSVIDIGNATRVNLSNGSPLYRTTIGRLVTPSSAASGTLEEQQRRALAHAQARAQAQGLEQPSKRTSQTSAISATADSILESFPFVPPSPISNRPARSPPVSPLGQQSFSVTPATPERQTFDNNQTIHPKTLGDDDDDSSLPAPPNRRTLGLSTGSQMSTASSGLGSFPFQIDSNEDGTSGATPYNGGRQRASLDTLAITSDLSSYPLGFDRDSHIPATKRN